MATQKALDYSRKLLDKFEGRITIDVNSYQGINKPVEGRCHKHGITFTRNAKSLLKSYGCVECKKELGNFNRVSKNEFLERAFKIFKGRFEYDLKNFKDFNSKVGIHCLKHNRGFYQTPTKHLESQGGCPSCKQETIRIKLSMDENAFLQRCEEVHGEKYDYSLVNYVNSTTKIIIKCKGCDSIFHQLPYNHVGNSQGCPDCAKYNNGSWGRKGVYKSNRISYLYVVEMNNGKDNFLKIGLSVNPEDRWRRLQSRHKTLQFIRPIFTTAMSARLLSKVESNILWKSDIEKYHEDCNWKWAGHSECFHVKDADLLLSPIQRQIEKLKGEQNG